MNINLVRLLILNFLLVLSATSYSQKDTDNLIVKGKILDSKTKEFVPYVNIYFIKSQQGISSSEHGDFSIQINKLNVSDTLAFSAIGYKTLKISFSATATLSYQTIYLEEDIVNLSAVTVTAQSAVEIIKQAMKIREKNYEINPHKLAGIYRITDRENGAYVRLIEAAVNIYDEDYMKKDSRVVDYLAVRLSKDFRTFRWKMDKFNARTVEELLKPDLIKRPTRASHSNGFEKGFFYAFERYSVLDGKEVYVISATKNPAYEWANYNATFYVRAEDLAIIRVDRDYSISRPNWAKEDDVRTKITKDQLILKYKDFGGKLYLNYFLWNLKGEVIEEKNKNKIISFDRSEELKIQDVSLEKSKKVRLAWDKDIYKMTEPYNTAFWENYPIPDTQLFQDVAKELGEKENLEKQFLSNDNYTIYDPKNYFKANELKQDFQLLRASLEQGHPALYRYTTKKELDQLFDSTYSLLSKPMTELDFYKLINPIIANIHCGHTHCSLSADYYKFSRYREFYFPVQVIFINDKLIVSENHTIDSLFKGDEILAVNGTLIHDLKKSIMPHIEADGYIETYKNKIFGQNFSELYNIHFGNNDSFVLRIRDIQGKVSEKILRGVSLSDFNKQKKNEDIKNEYEIIQLGVALMKVGTFTDIPNCDFKNWVKETFTAISQSNIDHLIIDLRGNSGGRDDYAVYLYSFLTKENFMYHSLLHSSTDNFTFLSYTNQDSSLNRIMQEITQPDSLGRFILRNSHPTLGLHKNRLPNYGGKVYFLIDGNTFSAASDFAAICQQNQVGVFIGEETGGTAIGNTSNGELILTLPITEIRVAIPLFMITNAVNGATHGRGILPNHLINYKVKDIADMIDKELEFTLKLIK